VYDERIGDQCSAGSLVGLIPTTTTVHEEPCKGRDRKKNNSGTDPTADDGSHLGLSVDCESRFSIDSGSFRL
jgi:hypothetical protein